MLRISVLILTGLVLAAAALAGAVAFGTADPPPPMPTLRAADITIGNWRNDLPPAAAVAARDGTPLSYRHYPGRPGAGLAILVHGSSGSAIAMHGVAQALQARGIGAIALDIRGHGRSGRRGDIEHLGQLTEDMADTLGEVERLFPAEQRLMIGHSSGGGFALRIAAGPLGCRLQGFIALSPYIGYDAPTVRLGPGGTQSGGWAKPFVPRIVGLIALRSIGITAFEHLPTVAFAIPKGMEAVVTPTYSFRLMAEFGLDRDWQAALARISRPTRVLVGGQDELFVEEAFAPIFARLQPPVPVAILAGVNHMGIVLDEAGQKATAEAAAGLLGAAAPASCQKP